jgi:hypothetical protein
MATVKVWLNNSKTCEIGTYRSNTAHRKPWDASFSNMLFIDGRDIVIKPGDTFFDETGTFSTLMSKDDYRNSKNVWCRDQAEADALGVPKKKRIFAPNDPELTDFPGEFVGFTGIRYALKDVTSDSLEAIKSAGSTSQAVAKIKELDDKTKVQAAQLAEKESELERIKRQLADFMKGVKK